MKFTITSFTGKYFFMAMALFLSFICLSPPAAVLAEERVDEDSTVSIIDPSHSTAMSTDLSPGSGFEYENSWGVQHVGCEEIHNLFI